MREFETLARGLYLPSQVHIDYEPALHLQVNAEEQAWMDTHWHKKLLQAKQNQTLLFDAPLFRLISASASTNTTLNLILGDTSYKEFVTTRVPEFAQKHNRSELGNPLSVCSVIETLDGYILLEQRQGVDIYVGRYHVIGGFFERDRDTRADQQPDPFAAMQREIREETGILPEDIAIQHSLGIVYDLATPHGEMLFLTQLRITLSEVQQRTPEDNEIQQLQHLHVDADSLRDFILKYHGNISATGEPNLLFYGAWKFGEPWLEAIWPLL
ncbi:MAG TPA: NUDIX hydrolase [Dictyobacter sp.]|jgi:8-oxo-dGTP pyrophosphatase MutT (NUDIX family)|nr:NUDIX hydrolase [Dictyobacter sp.]